MKTPPLLMAMALLLWGWQTNVLMWAVLIAVVLESSRFVSSKWQFSRADLHRVFDLCTVLFIGAAIILYASDETINRPFQFARWQPFVFLPLMLAQAFGSEEKIPLSALSWMLRRAKNHPLWKKSVNVSYLYLAVCLLGASAGNMQSIWFYPAMALIVAGALLAVKPSRFRMPVWGVMLAAAGAMGYYGHVELHRLQTVAEEMFGRWIGNLLSRQENIRQSRTAIGHIGRLKLSGKIVWRVEAKPGEPAPPYLRQLIYDNYYGDKEGTWRATRMEFGDAALEADDKIRLLPAKSPFHIARISGALPRSRGILPLPLGSFEIAELPANIKTNAMAVARVEGLTFVNFDVSYGAGDSLDGAPTEFDSLIPPNEEAVLAQIAEDLQLASKTTREKLKAIERFFQNNFTYSTYIDSSHVDPTGQQTPLGLFLTKNRSGHCEYFATATVLLLRQAGVPARYAVGYAVQESRNGKNYVVRERHAHAWTLVHVDGTWMDFDTTPPSWEEAERVHASFWEPVTDFFSRIWHEFSKWRWSKTNYTKYLIWVLIPLVVYMVWRIVFKTQRKKTASQADENVRSWPGLDSEFYVLERKVSELGLARQKGEPLLLWQERLADSPIMSAQKWESVLLLHHRYRFDPNGLNGEERQQLKSEVEKLLADLNQRSAAN